MDIGDDESALIHSKFHKAKRGLLLSSSCSSSTTAPISQNQAQQSPQASTSSSGNNSSNTPTSAGAVSLSSATPPPSSSSSSSSSDATLSADTSSTVSVVATAAPVVEEIQIESPPPHYLQLHQPPHILVPSPTSPTLLSLDSASISPVTPTGISPVSISSSGGSSSLVESIGKGPTEFKLSPEGYHHHSHHPSFQQGYHPPYIHAKFEISQPPVPQHIPHQLHQSAFGGSSGGTTAVYGTNLVATPSVSPSSSSSSSIALGSIGGSSSVSSLSGPLSASSTSSGLSGILGGPPTQGPPTIQPPLPMPGNTSIHPGRTEQVFRFDSTDRERYLCSAISEEDEEVFSPGPSPSSLSTRSFDSPHIILDSPRITISPLRIEDSPPTGVATLTPSPIMDSQNGRLLFPRVHTGLAVLPPTTNIDQARCLFGVPSSPVSPLTPNTPLSPSPLSPHEHMFQQGILEELYRRRCHSDSDLPCLPDSPKLEPTDLSVKSNSRPGAQRTKRWIPHPLVMPAIKSGSLESDQSTPQDSPLDLSMKGSRERFGSTPSCDSFGTSRSISSLVIPPQTQGGGPLSPGVAVISPTTRHSVALRYNLEVSPVVEESRPGADMGFVCPVCGQVFSLHDRLAKHMASRHKSKPHDPNKSYPCEVCHRSFARSDMLTRHVRLHTGVKPYTCKMCGQVFSRSDHLSTHQRTHTGEKPYKCPQCPYSACRRDMITRHLRTHTRNSSSSSSDLMSGGSGSTTTPSSTSSSEPILDERMIKSEFSRPPSSSSSFAPESPTQLSPALNLGSLSVHSPPPSS